MQMVSAAPPPLYFMQATFVEGVIAIAAFGISGLIIARAAIACARLLFNLPDKMGRSQQKNKVLVITEYYIYMHVIAYYSMITGALHHLSLVA